MAAWLQKEATVYFDIAQSPTAALEILADQSDGFCFTDAGITHDDLNDFDRLQICINKDLNEFGSFETLEKKIADFLSALGPNEAPLVEKIAFKIDRLAKGIIAISGKETAWVCLRAATSNHKYDIPRWHMDGHYFNGGKDMQYKFILTLIGPSSLFCSVPNQFIELRRIIWIHMTNRLFMHELCQSQNVVQPERGIGVFFIAGDQKTAALHSEPPISENRLTFSVVPCNTDQIDTLRQKVGNFYRYKSSVND